MSRVGANALLVAASLVLSIVVGEGATRLIDGLPLLTDWLPADVDRDVVQAHVDEIPRAAGIDRAWFFVEPRPLANRREPPAEWARIAREIQEAPFYSRTAFRPWDYFKAWNSTLLPAACVDPFFKSSPGHVYAHRPVDGALTPRYRFLPNATTPFHLVTNELGWRGPPVAFRRAEKVVRIVFVGASTTVDNHYVPFSHPELVGHWLNLWASARGLGVRFETLNAGRESAVSMDIAAVVEKEVAPLRPDLVIYLEGMNQFEPGSVVPQLPAAPPALRADGQSAQHFATLMQDAAHRSALVRRLRVALGVMNPGHGGEWPKPDYRLVWPAGLSESDPDLARGDLPVSLSIILRDLDRMRASLARIGADFAISSFKWMVHDGMVLDPVRHKAVIEHLNVAYFPFRYRDMERLAVFQNRVLAKYARTHGLLFLDQAAAIPDDPDLFVDAVHLNYGGVRLRAWSLVQMLLPIIEARLAAGAWPSPLPPVTEPPPGLFYTPELVTFDCKDR